MTKSTVRVKDLLAVLEEIARPSLAESWDNVGLMVGDPDQEISGVLVALDPTEEIFAEAARRGCDAVVTHHPLIFKPLQAIRTDQVSGRLLARALSAGIAVVGCHTNLDKVAGGVNDILAARLGLEQCRVLAEDPDGGGTGFGRVGRLKEGTTFEGFIDHLLVTMDLAAVRVAGVIPEQVETVAVCGGSGSELAMSAAEAGAQVFVTGEVKHSNARWAEDEGFCVVDAGHFSTEKLVVPGLVAAVAKGIEDQGLSLKVVATEVQKSPFQYYQRK
jgi:dinuclear metal center YbgI/SA1388 family protein